MNLHDHLLWFVIACFALAFLCLYLRSLIPKDEPMRRSAYRASWRIVQRLGLFAMCMQAGCATLTPTQGALIVDAASLAQAVLPAVAAVYGGPAAGQLASAGFSALATVAQGYVGSKIPSSVIEATPGIAQMGQIAAGYINPSKTVTQQDVAVLNAAAVIAAPKAN